MCMTLDGLGGVVVSVMSLSGRCMCTIMPYLENIGLPALDKTNMCLLTDFSQCGSSMLSILKRAARNSRSQEFRYLLAEEC